MWRSLRNALRLVGLGWTLARYGTLYPFETLPQAPGIGFLIRVAQLFRARQYDALRPGQRFAAALTELGPAFIKFGQSLATRSDLVGEQFAQDLAELQDRIPPFPASDARATIEKELQGPVHTFFQQFEDKPVAAASIAQVHFATTIEGKNVAVKILRPDIEKSFARDLDLFLWIAEFLDRVLPAIRRLKPIEVVEVFAETVEIEMDLRFEAAAAAELRDNFEDDPDFHVPAVDWQRTARRVLTSEKLNGTRIDDIQALTAEGHEPSDILRKSACIFFNQVFRDGFFHADMHPGNMFVLPDGKLAPVDFGIMGRLDIKTRYFLADMLIGFLTGDYRMAADVHFKAGWVPAHKSIDAFTQACRSIGEPIMGKPLHEISLARLLGQLFQITETFEMETQPQLLLLQKTMLVAEGVGRSLDPTVNMWELARPLIEDWMRQNRGPEARVRLAASEGLDALERLPHLLDKADRAFSDLADGGIKLHPDTLAAFSAKRSGNSHWVILAILVAVLVFAFD